MDASSSATKTEFPQRATGEVIAFLTTWFLSIVAILAGVQRQVRAYSQNSGALAAILISFAFLFAVYWFPGFPALRRKLEIHYGRAGRAILAGSFLIMPYLVYGAGTGALNAVSLSKLILICGIPLGLYATLPARSQKLCWQDVTAMLVIAAPVYCGWYRGVWPVPIYLDIMARLFTVSLAAFAFLSVRRLEDTGYLWRVRGSDWFEGAKQLVFFSIIGIPLGFSFRFIAWHPRNEGIAAGAYSFVGIFLFIAVAEELFFRGILQNLLEKTVKNKYLARGLASAVFGFSHIHHGFPNWRYVLMAGIAGWFYGTAWHNRRSIMASSFTHAAVDALWRQFFLMA